MGMVTDVEWKCLNCGTQNIAQIYDDWYGEDQKPLSHKAIPFRAASLKWNPPCKKCGEYQLQEPSYLIELPIVSLADASTREGEEGHRSPGTSAATFLEPYKGYEFIFDKNDVAHHVPKAETAILLEQRSAMLDAILKQCDIEIATENAYVSAFAKDIKQMAAGLPTTSNIILTREDAEAILLVLNDAARLTKNTFPAHSNEIECALSKLQSVMRESK